MIGNEKCYRGYEIKWIGPGYYRFILKYMFPRCYWWVPITEAAYHKLIEEGYNVLHIASENELEA